MYTKYYDSRNVDVAPEVWSIKNVVCGIVCLLALAWTAPKFGPEDTTPVAADSRVLCYESAWNDADVTEDLHLHLFPDHAI